MINRSILLSLLFISLIAPMNFAQPLNGRLSLGYTDSSGNTDEQKLNFDFDFTQKKSEKLNLVYKGLFNYGKAAGVTNSDKKKVKVLSEFVKDVNSSYYANLGVLQDKFAGYESQKTLGLGYLQKIFVGEQYNLSGALGGEFTRDEYTDSTNKTRSWFRAGLNGDRQMAENIKMISELVMVAPKDNFEDQYQVDFALGSVFTVNTQFDLEMKYSVSYKKQPVVTGKQKQDAIFYTNLVYKL